MGDLRLDKPFVGRRILIVDDEVDTLDACAQILSKDGYEVETSDNAPKALEMVKSRLYDVALTDLKMPKMDGIELLKAIKRVDPEVAVVMITGYATIETAVESMKEGAYNYIPKPFTPDELRIVVRKALEKQDLWRENRELKERLYRRGEDLVMVGEGEEMGKLRQLIERVAATDSTVLIYGETGTGKELVAREIHGKSRRVANPMVTVNCAAIPTDLLESELFGYEKGAFTGATRRKKGSFELAHGGSLFLDEIGSLGLDLQAKILRALQEKEINPVGSERRMFVDVRIIAATNRNLKEATKKGEFREDLFYRLNVVPIRLAPLRERKEDIPLLVEHFLQRYNRKLNKRIQGITEEAMGLLMVYDWPGNIRELENAVERAMILEDGEMLDLRDFRQIVHEGEEEWADRKAPPEGDLDLQSLPSLEKVERDYILEVLRATKWNRKRASEILGISTVTIWRKVQGQQ
ncbi:MAG: sigma-54-dependent Fis family transcriptional regulator [candidate division NC10 bacterium]|nr:sigma-54-dependent Fis family transcriptional regulator [candidate division NC10 bacterium]